MGILDEVLEQIDNGDQNQNNDQAQQQEPAKQEPQQPQQPHVDNDAKDSGWYGDEFKRSFHLQ